MSKRVPSKRRKTRPGYGGKKGGAFERTICVLLSLWVSGGKRRDLFWRSAMSGGRATVALRKGIDLSNQAGDIIAIDKMGIQLTGKFFLELKHRRDLNYETFILQYKGSIVTFWEKALRQAKEHGRVPMMIIRGNNKPTLMIVPPEILENYCPDAEAAVVGTYIPDIYLFDEVMKCPFKKQSLPRHMLKEGLNDKPLRRFDTRRIA